MQHILIGKYHPRPLQYQYSTVVTMLWWCHAYPCHCTGIIRMQGQEGLNSTTQVGITFTHTTYNMQ